MDGSGIYYASYFINTLCLSAIWFIRYPQASRLLTSPDKAKLLIIKFGGNILPALPHSAFFPPHPNKNNLLCECGSYSQYNYCDISTYSKGTGT